MVHYGRPVRIYLLRRLEWRSEVRGTFIGEISPDYLWGTVDQSVPSPNTGWRCWMSWDECCSARRSAPVGTPGASHRDLGDTSLARTKENYLTATSAIPLDAAFAGRPGPCCSASPRTKCSSQWWSSPTPSSRGRAFQPAVLLLSMSQIRRSVLPLDELQKGPRRIAQRDFTSRVTVNSRDEFEELATSFNTMATQLGRQFNALATAAEIDRAVLSATDATDIVDTVLGRIRDVFPCGMVSVTLGVPDGAKSLTSVVHDYETRGTAHRADLLRPSMCRVC